VKMPEYKSKTKHGVVYQTTKDKSGNYTCDCPGYKYTGDCRHIALEKRKSGYLGKND